jgi:hypothetical protein
MWRPLMFLMGVTTVFFSVNTLAQTTEEVTQTTSTIVTAPAGERRMIVTDVPAPKVVTTAPVNYVNCFRVEAGWRGDVWVPSRQICQYSNTPEGVAWVEGYWMCVKYNSENCTSWDWKDAHWVKVLDVY